MAIINTSIKNIKDVMTKEGITILVTFSISIASFSLGTIYEQERFSNSITPSITHNETIVEAWNTYQATQQQSAQYFASKSGTKVYPLDCKAGNRVKEENRIFFTSLDQAEDAGYELSSQC